VKLSTLKSKGICVFSVAQAEREGISAQLIAHYLKRGLIDRISHGVYRFADSPLGADLESLILEKLKAIPQGVVGYKTAIRLYGLTEEVPAEIDILVPATNIPKRKLEDVALHPVKTAIYRKAVQKLRGIPVTSLERTIVDLLRSGEPLSLILSICREARSKRIPLSLTKLKKLGATFRAKNRVEILIGALL
jgi:predicted transcriptional regulator of viral defense system